MNKYRRYLIHFANEHLDFRIAEFKSVAEMFNVTVNQFHDDKKSPFVIVDLPSDAHARQIASRTILVKSIYHLWGTGESFADMCSNISSLPSQVTDPYRLHSFLIRVNTFNKIVQMPDKIAKIENLLDSCGVKFEGKVDLKNPVEKFHLLEYYGPQKSDPPLEPFNLFFGRWVADGQRDIIKKYHLTTRKFIGSLLVACAHYGAYVAGCDIDYQIIHCRGRSSRKGQKLRKSDESIASNLDSYGLSSKLVDYMVADSSKHQMWRHNPQPLYQQIITDPPYGIREKTSQVASIEDFHSNPPSGPPANQQRFPKKTQYGLQLLLTDLLNFAAVNLTVGGRLTFWLPVYRPDYTEADLPTHQCLRLEYNCEQILTMKISRRLITMTKTCEMVIG